MKFYLWKIANVISYNIKCSEANILVSLFFCKRGEGKQERACLTDLSIAIFEEYHIYTRSWVREVTFKDNKTLLNLSRCQSVDSAGQITNSTLTMMLYNILYLVKRNVMYKIIVGFFSEVTYYTLELSVTDKIWAIILDFVLEAAERYSIDATELLADFIESNPVAHTLRNMYIYKLAS